VETNYRSLNYFFDDVLQDLPCQSDTKAYITGIFSKYKDPSFDLSKDSVTIIYAQARDKQDFSQFQNLGDWIFFSKTFVPGVLHGASDEYYRTVGRMSYYTCYRMINRQWKLFEEMADNFIVLERATKKLLSKNLNVHV